jgi:Tetratricopeptide repeat
LYNAAWYAWKIGNKVEAEKMSVEAMRVRKKVLGPDHKDTFWSIVMVMVGGVYDLRGRWDVAEELDVQVMEARKKKVGADHPHTLTSMNNLTFTWKERVWIQKL